VNTGQLNIRGVPGGAVISVKVVPGSSRDKVVGVLGEALKIATAAAAEKGRANLAVASTLARALGVDSRRVTLARGQASPRKEFHVAGLSVDEVRRKLRELS